MIISVITAFSIYMPVSFGALNSLLVRNLEKRLHADISYDALRVYLWRSLTVDGLKGIGKGGFGFDADKVTVDYDLTSLVTGRLHLRCSFENARFYRSGNIVGSLVDMLQIEPLGNLTFKSIEGDLFVGRQDTLTQNFAMVSDNIKVFGNASTDIDDDIRVMAYILLNESLVDTIPKEIRGTLLQKEEGPWSSIYVRIMGNYKKPNLRIMTDRFRMNIASK